MENVEASVYEIDSVDAALELVLQAVAVGLCLH